MWWRREKKKESDVWEWKEILKKEIIFVDKWYETLLLSQREEKWALFTLRNKTMIIFSVPTRKSWPYFQYFLFVKSIKQRRKIINNRAVSSKNRTLLTSNIYGEKENEINDLTKIDKKKTSKSFAVWSIRTFEETQIHWTDEKAMMVMTHTEHCNCNYCFQFFLLVVDYINILWQRM